MVQHDNHLRSLCYSYGHTGHPLDTIKVRLQTQSSVNPEFSGMGDCIRKTIAREGFMVSVCHTAHYHSISLATHATA